MAITPTTLSDSAVPSYSTLQDGDLTIFERAGVPGKTSYLQIRSELATEAWNWTGNWTWSATLTNPSDFRNSLGLGSVATESTVPVAKGGTGATTVAAARTNLGLGSVAQDNIVPVARGGTGATDALAARAALGLGAVATDSIVPLARGGTGATDAAGARTAIGLGSLATLSSVATANLDAAERLNTSNVLTAFANLTTGALGSVALLARITTSSQIAVNTVYAGSDLIYYGVWGTSSAVSGPATLGASVSGSWRALGDVQGTAPGGSPRAATLFVRVL
jgi:hypothetical protein